MLPRVIPVREYRIYILVNYSRTIPRPADLTIKMPRGRKRGGMTWREWVAKCLSI